MATYIAEAIEIITDDGRGIPKQSLGLSAIGLADDGHFYLITDRFDLDGGKTITGDTAQTTWYEGILTRDFGAFAISRSCDFVEAGAMEQVSGLNFAIKNTGSFFSTLQTNGVYLSRRRVKYYRVTSSDGVTFDFEQRWEGVIEDQPFNELAYSIKCIDVSKDIFKNSPAESVNDATFEDAPDDSKDKTIPIAIGRVAYSPLVAVTQPGKKVVLVRTVLAGDTIEYTGCGLRNYDIPSLTVNLYTKGVSFVENDSRLLDCALIIIAGGADQSVRILSNLATDGSENTNVTLEEPLTGSFLGWSAGATTPSMWFAEVQKISATLIASQKPISEIKENIHGRAALSTFYSESRKYRDVSDISRSQSESNIKGTGHPGVDIFSKALDVDGEATAYYKIRCQDIQFRVSTGLTYSGPAGSQINLFDEDQTTGYQVTSSTSGGAVQLDITLPRSALDQDYTDLLLMVDAKFRLSSGASGGHSFAYNMYAQDVYGQDSIQIGSQVVPLNNQALTTSDTERFSIHGNYYNSESSPALFYTLNGDASLSSLMDGLKKARAFPRIMIHMFFQAGSLAYIADILEIALIGKRTLNVVDTPVYSSLVGETFGTTWDGRKTPADPIQDPIEAFEHILRNYDTSAPVWKAGTAYVVGGMIRGTADTGHIFVCTTAGTSHASTEPTWTDTAGATYTDGTAAWKEFRTIPVDTATFDAASAQRAAWKVGRTLVDKKPSEEWYKQLLAQAFLIGTLDAQGKVQVKAWRENTTALAAFSSATNIIEGTVEEIDPTPMRRVYNDIQIRYDWNPGAQKFNKQITVTKADQPAFPGQSDADGDETDLGTFTITHMGFYAGVARFQVGCDSPHGLSTGDFASLSGNADGFDFEPRVVSVLDADYFYVDGQVTTAGSTSSGTLVQNSTSTLLWKTFVTGIQNYATAAALWEQCRASYLISKTIQKLPEELGDCRWYFDPYAKGPDGGYIWSDDGGLTCNLDVGDDHAAVFFAQNIVDWTAWQKKQVSFEVADTAAFSALEIGNPITFADAKLTGGTALPGWIQKKMQVPRTKDQPERFRFGVILNPEQLVDPDTIDENGADAGDIIDENSASAGNIIDENGA